jgi:NADPH:quinone reductase-like Zn-dependent oxidoreductase
LELGADRFVDLEQDRWWDTVDQMDVVYDAIGGDVLARSVATVRPGGALVTVMAPPPEVRPDIRTVLFIREPDGAQLKELAQMVDDGKLCVPVGAVYPLTEARTAFTDQFNRTVRGKVILQPWATKTVPPVIEQVTTIGSYRPFFFF